MYPVPPCPHRNERRTYTNTYLNISGSLRIRYAALRFDVPVHHHLGSLILIPDGHAYICACVHNSPTPTFYFFYVLGASVGDYSLGVE